MKELNFDTGVVTFSINGKCDISFNPTDPVFAKRLFSTFELLDERYTYYKSRAEKTAKNSEVFDLYEEMDKEMRQVIDSVFGEKTCEKIFGDLGLYAMANGLPVWCNLMLTVIDESNTSFAREQKLTSNRIAKYTAKYKK